MTESGYPSNYFHIRNIHRTCENWGEMKKWGERIQFYNVFQNFDENDIDEYTLTTSGCLKLINQMKYLLRQ